VGRPHATAAPDHNNALSRHAPGFGHPEIRGVIFERLIGMIILDTDETTRTLDWLGAPASVRPFAQPPWIVQIQTNYFILESSAWNYLGQPKGFQLGWDQDAHGLWLIPDVHGYHVVGLTRHNQMHRQLATAPNLRFGHKSLINQCRTLGLGQTRYWTLPRYYPNTDTYALYVPASPGVQDQLNRER